MLVRKDTHGKVVVTTLRFGKVGERLGEIADAAMDLDGLATDAVPASGMTATREGLGAFGDHGVAQEIELSLGVGILHADLLAGGALDSGVVSLSVGLLGWAVHYSPVGNHDIVEPV